MVVPAITTATSATRCSPAELAAARAEISQLRAELQAAKAAARAREARASLRLQQTTIALAKSRAQGNELQRRLELSEQLRVRERTRSRTPTERVIRRAFAAKVEELALTHARTTARMLNVQKRCFEEELETLESEANATVTAFERHISSLRNESNLRMLNYQREKDAALSKTSSVLNAVKKRMEIIETKYKNEQNLRKRAELAANQRHNHLINLCNRFNGIQNEIKRKNSLINTLQVQLDNSSIELKRARELANIKSKSSDVPKRGGAGGAGGTPAKLLHARSSTTTTTTTTTAIAQRNDTDTERLGAVFASVMADFVNAQSDVSSGDGDVDRVDIPAAATPPQPPPTTAVHVTSSATA